MKNLFKRLPAIPSKWIYWFFRQHYTVLLLGEMLDAQYPGIDLRRDGKQFGTVVAMNSLHYIYLDGHNNLQVIRRNRFRGYRWAEYQEKKERLALWLKSDALARIKDGLRAIKKNGVYSQYELHKPDGSMEYISGFGLICIPIYSVYEVEKYLWVAATHRLFDCKAFLPSQIRLRPLSVTQRK